MRRASVGILAAATLLACHKRPAPDDHRAPILARVGDTVITSRDMEARLASFSRSKRFLETYANPEKKKDLLNSMIESEILYQEARRKGYDQDPAVKREAVNRMLQAEIDAHVKPEDISDAEIEKYYQEHSSQFSRPDQVRLTQIVVKDQKKAAKAAREAKAIPKGNLEALRALVNKYSEDETSRAKGGEVGLVDRNTSSIPKPILEAALAAKDVFDVTEPIKTDAGYTIVIVTQKVPGFSRSLQEAKPTIQSSLLFEKRRQKRTALAAELRQKTHVQIDEAQLAQVDLTAPAGESAPGKDRPGPRVPPPLPPSPPAVQRP